MKLRISGGELRGRRLAGPRRGDPMRPTTERAREAIFSILGEIGGARVLDLYCGTGALGIEALSRGAASAVMVDSDVSLARRNVEALGLESQIRLIRSDALRYLDRAPEGGFDLVLCDPPYALAERLADDIDRPLRRALAPGGRLMAETPPGARPLSALPLAVERTHGETLVRIHVAPTGGEGAE